MSSWINDRILILDDNVARHRLFRVIYGPRESLHAHGVEHLRDRLSDLKEHPGPLSVVFLDHDLTPAHYRDEFHDDECGCAAVKVLIDFYDSQPPRPGHPLPKIVVHSRNNKAAFTMMSKLSSAGFNVIYMPFE